MLLLIIIKNVNNETDIIREEVYRLIFKNVKEIIWIIELKNKGKVIMQRVYKNKAKKELNFKDLVSVILFTYFHKAKIFLWEG